MPKGGILVTSKTVIEKCTCQNEYQDQMYGEGMRVKNAKSGGAFRCTVCGQ